LVLRLANDNAQFMQPVIVNRFHIPALECRGFGACIPRVLSVAPGSDPRWGAIAPYNLQKWLESPWFCTIRKTAFAI